MSILIVTSRSPAALEALAAPEGRPLVIHPVDFGPQVVTADVTAVILDGVGADPWLRDAVAGRGLNALAIGASVFGVEALNQVTPGEVIVTDAGSGHPLAERLDRQFAVVDGFTPLRLADAPAAEETAATVVMTVNHRFVEWPTLVAGTWGRGRFVVSGLGRFDSALASPVVAALLRRALRPGLPQTSRPSLGLGVAGYGRFGGMGTIHGRAAMAVDGLSFVATCDRDPERRKAAEHDFPGIGVHATIEDLAADDDVEIAVVATPPASHFHDVLALLGAGKHVVCEKPLCLTAAEADELMAEAGRCERLLTVNQNRRFDADYLAIRRAITEGLLGEVFNIETFVGGFEHPCRAWHSEESISGGMAYDWGSHHIDWIVQLMGSQPTAVSAVGHKRVWHDVTNLDQIRVRMGWDDGREAQFVCSDVAAVRPPKFYVQGTAATLVGTYRPLRFEHVDRVAGYQVDVPHHAEAPAEIRLACPRTGVGLSETILPTAAAPEYAFHRNLVDHLQLGDPVAVTAASVREVIAVLEAANHSVAAGGAAIALERRDGPALNRKG